MPDEDEPVVGPLDPLEVAPLREPAPVVLEPEERVAVERWSAVVDPAAAAELCADEELAEDLAAAAADERVPEARVVVASVAPELLAEVATGPALLPATQTPLTQA